MGGRGIPWLAMVFIGGAVACGEPEHRLALRVTWADDVAHGEPARVDVLLRPRAGGRLERSLDVTTGEPLEFAFDDLVRSPYEYRVVATLPHGWSVQAVGETVVDGAVGA